MVVSLAPAGRDLLQAVTAARRQAIAQIVRGVPPDRRGAMVDALQAFSDAAGELPDHAWAIAWDRL